MKLIDKLKNALFEEEYVEVEEKVKKPKIKKEPKREKKELVKEVEEKPIAKKIVPPERKEVKITHHEDKNKTENEDQKEGETLAIDTVKVKERRFPLVSDNEFNDTEKLDLPPKKEEKPPKNRYHEESHHYEKPVYKEKEHKKSRAYGMTDLELPETMYGAYEKKEERGYFHPSPIISPIYGILDKNYKKEEIIPKREIHLSSSYTRENLNVDEVRDRAFGNLSDDIMKGPDLEQYEIDESNLEGNDLLDLREEKPEVKKVTVGDAEEYFEDLGLEYNVDYKDASKETRVGRREQEPSEPEIIEEHKVEEKEEIPTDEDNLFDLIDSMYEKE